MANVTTEFEEVKGSPTESNSGGKFSATRILRCNWADRKTLADQILGVDLPLFQIPMAYPGVPSCLARGIGIIPEGELITSSVANATTANTYNKAILTVSFETRDITQTAGEETLIEESIEPSAEFVNLPHYKLQWNTDPVNRELLQSEEAPGRIFRQADWNVTIYNLKTVPSGIISLMGYVNDQPLLSLSLGVTFPAETLLFHGGAPSRIITTSGKKGWRLGIKFTAKPYSWNKFLKRGQSVPQTIYHDPGTGLEAFRPYPTANFETELNYR